MNTDLGAVAAATVGFENKLHIMVGVCSGLARIVPATLRKLTIESG